MTTETPYDAASDGTASRRAVLQGGAVAGVAAVAGFVAFSVRDEAPAVGSTYGGGTDGGEVLARVADVPDGGGVVITSAQVVLTRDGDEITALSAVCPHQGCLVSGVRDGVILCPCHASRFDARTGEVLAGPARTGLPPVAVRVDGDAITTA